MKKVMLIVGIAAGMNATVAVAQHEDMPGHENMPSGEHAKHNKKKDGDADKKQPPKPDDQKHEGHKKGS